MSGYRFACGVDTHRSPVAQLAIDIVADGSRCVVAVGGELEPATEHQLTTFVDRLVQQHEPLHLTLDLAPLTLCSAAGIRALLHVRSVVAARGGELVLRDPAPLLLKVLTITGDAGRFEIRHSETAPA